MSRAIELPAKTRRLIESVTVWFSKDEHALVVKVAGLRHELVGGFVRRAVMKEIARLGFLTDDERQALELDRGHSQER